jgi:TPR repeat protein
LQEWYCSKECQRFHWRQESGHKKFCTKLEDRKPATQLEPFPAACKTTECCAICLDEIDPVACCRLPCTHSFHRECVEALRKYGIKSVCPMCRTEMPPGAEKLFDDAMRSWFLLYKKDRKSNLTTLKGIFDQLKCAADQGHGLAQSTVGMFFYEGYLAKPDFEKAIWWFRKSAEKGIAEAEYMIGVMYANGEHVKKDWTEAAHWCHRSAKRGDRQAQYRMGVCFANGQGVAVDTKASMRWFLKAANQDCAKSQFLVGLMYYDGMGVGQNFAVAARWYKIAAANGELRAQCSLAFMYMQGEGVEQSDALAVSCFLKAAQAGDALAEFNLGCLFKSGEHGVEKDHAAAARWFAQAALHGCAKAQDVLASMCCECLE